jgi:hypothetical protein
VSVPQKPLPAKLVTSLFMRDRALFRKAVDRLADKVGSVDMVSPWLPFDETDYYSAEMGFPLFRRLVTFHGLIEQETLAGIKVFTNDIEAFFTEKGSRMVNIDPGYLLAERFVLATGKNFTHRIYLKNGIYADLTLIFQKGHFRALEWTYPDYAGTPIVNFLRTVREKYLFQLKSGAIE